MELTSKKDDEIKKISGYSIYNQEQMRRTVRNDLPQFYPDLPEKNIV
jgi:hypothetical protein